MVRDYIKHHDHKLSFFAIFLFVGIGLTLFLNLSVLIFLIFLHTILDFAKYRMNKLSRGRAFRFAVQDQLIDLMFVFLSITLAVYLSRKTPGVVGLSSIRALEEITMFSIVRSIPRFALIENMVKGFSHSVEHFRHHVTHLKIPQFGDWQVFAIQMIVYCVLLIGLAPALTALSYGDVWHHILAEVSPWHIGAH